MNYNERLSPSVLIAAHRGASGMLAEHTLPAYELALQQNADGVECDVRLTRDGHLVCLHDRKIDRTSNGHGSVSSMSLDQLQKFRYGDLSISQEYNSTLLMLTDLIELLLDYNRPITLFIETKHSIFQGMLLEEQLLKILHHYNLLNQFSRLHVVVISFSLRSIRYIKQHSVGLSTVLLGRRSYYWDSRLSRRLKVSAIGPSIQDLRIHPEIVSKAIHHGQWVYCWTVDKEEDIDFCRWLGVSWIATNYPARASYQLRAG